MFEGLRSEIESLAIPVEGEALAEAFTLYDQLAACLCSTVAEFDAAGLWESDGATSMTAWLADRARMVRRRAASRTITPPMWNALAIRDRRCRFKRCDRPAAWCEGHHVRPWQCGGPTNLLNLVMLCSRHHHLIHKPGWQAKLLPDATFEVIDPRGRVYTTKPPTRTPPLPIAA